MKHFYYTRKFSKRSIKNGAESYHKLTQEGIPYARKYQKWETTKGYQRMDQQGRFTPSFFCDQVKFLYCEEHKVKFEVRLRLQLLSRPTHHHHPNLKSQHQRQHKKQSLVAAELRRRENRKDTPQAKRPGNHAVPNNNIHRAIHWPNATHGKLQAQRQGLTSKNRELA